MVHQYQTFNKSFEHNIKSKNNHAVYCSSNRDKRARKEPSTYGPRSEDTGGTSLYFSNEQKTDTSCVKAD